MKEPSFTVKSKPEITYECAIPGKNMLKNVNHNSMKQTPTVYCMIIGVLGKPYSGDP